MSVVGAFAAKFIRPPDESIVSGANLVGSVCEGRPPRTSLAIMVPNEEYVELSERLFSTSRNTVIG
jgi:hypothetical protein